jgi:hypothetical protein
MNFRTSDAVFAMIGLLDRYKISPDLENKKQTFVKF